ncbi:unnamed protein product [Sphagnum jensenii]|uniref:Enoyl reductase (ER) domain-containing protein n=1 Tax=Sphagnum jensenii TaxID=128206 RepID=A0ABP0WYP1_9BRYO
MAGAAGTDHKVAKHESNGGTEFGAEKIGKKFNKDDVGDENLAAYIFGIDDLRLQPYKLPPVGKKDVKVTIKAVGICGSDVAYVKHLQVGNYVVKEPMVIGHECAGVVEEIGSEVKDLAVGDRVALEPGVPCWACSLCKQGLYNLCPDMKFFATPPVQGALAKQVVHPAGMCFKLPENVTLEEGAMCEPLSVAVHTCNRSNVGPATRVLVIGGGAIGLVTLLCAKAFGSLRVVVADTHNERLSVAKALGADAVVLISKKDEDMERELKEIQDAMGAPIDVTCDCVGTRKSLTTALEATTSAGRVCLVGMRESNMNLPIAAAAAREVDLVGVFRYRHTYPLCLDLISSGRVNVKPLITNRFHFSQQEVKDAFKTSAEGKGAIKVMFDL